MSSFTDQLPRFATDHECKVKWCGKPPGEWFRCYLCGHKFLVGDYWRFVFGGKSGLTNFMVCKSCDGDDVIDRFIAHCKDLDTKYWWFSGVQ